MAGSWCCFCWRRRRTTAALLLLILLPGATAFSPAAPAMKNSSTLLPAASEVKNYRRIASLLRRINKPAVDTIRSPDGDLVDCVPMHLQPAFDHPRLRGHAILDPPERPPKASNRSEEEEEEEEHIFQLWTTSGKSCPQGTIPIRRTTHHDILRASSIKRFGRKPPAAAAAEAAGVRRDSESSSHEHAVGYVAGDEYYGAKASINVWTPRVKSSSEFSLSQIWVIGGSFGGDLNTIEAGWQVSPQLYGDDAPRFFTYWTTDAYQATGCYNLLCSGFVQTNSRIVMGAAIAPVSSYRTKQFDISLLVWKDPNHGNWWLQFGSGTLVGYWPSALFSHLADHASMVQFGGEVVNAWPGGAHTSTQMGSGHFAGEGFGRASYFRNLEVVDSDNSLVAPTNLKVVADHPSCYDVRDGVNGAWGNYFYYGGPGRNERCP